jgi:RimJ/RimL family protein N-acetyltransferase
VLHTLTDGTPYRIRPLGPDDEPALAALVERFSPETIRRRFLSPKPGLTRAELRFLTHVDQRDHLALAAVPVGDPGRLLGVARCVRLAPGGDVADFAIAIADAEQGQGVGTALSRALADAARAAGIRRFEAVTLAENTAVMRLMRRFAAKLHDCGMSGGLRELRLDLAT